MMLYLTPQFLVLCLTMHAGHGLSFDDPVLMAASSHQLHAAVKHSDIRRRANSFQPVYGASLTYADADSKLCYSQIGLHIPDTTSRHRYQPG